jgi:hypothetical protein
MDGFFADSLVLLLQINGQAGPVLAVVGAFGMEFPALIAQLGPLGEGAMGAVVWEPGISLSGDVEGSRAYEAGFARQSAIRRRRSACTATRRPERSPRRWKRRRPASSRPGRDAIRDALRKTDLLLPLERLRFDEHGDPLHYEVGVFQIQSGWHVLLFPPHKATGDIVRPKPDVPAEDRRPEPGQGSERHRLSFFIEAGYLEWQVASSFILDGGVILVPFCRNRLEYSRPTVGCGAQSRSGWESRGGRSARVVSGEMAVTGLQRTSRTVIARLYASNAKNVRNVK